MESAAGTQQVVDAAAAGDAKKALKKLSHIRWSYYGDDAPEVLEQVALEAERIARTNPGRIAKKAEKLAASARETAEHRRRQRVIAAKYEPRAAEAAGPGKSAGYEVTPVSLGIGLVSAGLMLIAIFLPRVESNTFFRVEKNTLIQSGDGWIFLLLALAIAGAVWHAFYSDVRSVAPGVLGLIAIGVAIYDGTNKSSLTLCPVSPGASQLGIGCSTASPGIGIYMAGVGGALAVIAALQIWRSRPRQADAATADALAARPFATPSASAPMPGPPAAEQASSIEDRIRTLQNLRDQNLIDDAEFQERRAKLLDTL